MLFSDGIIVNICKVLVGAISHQSGKNLFMLLDYKCIDRTDSC